MTTQTSRQVTQIALKELRSDFVRRGWYEKAPRRVVFELCIHLACALGGILLFLLCHVLALRIFGLLLSTYGGMGVGANTHSSTHYATSNKRWVNEALSYFGFPLFLGVSATFWWHKHVTVHHPAPNVVGVDTDADLSPWFAMTVDEVRASSGWLRFYYERLQFWVFPLALAGTCFNMQASGLAYLVRKLFEPAARHERRAPLWIDAAMIALHFGLWIGLPLLIWPFWPVISFYLLRVALLGYAMYIVLAPGHFPAEAQRTTLVPGDDVSFFEIQTAGSLNFRTGFAGRLLCSGLEYQVEHHLFPNISHVHYPQISVAVQAFCDSHGLSYRSLSWSEALWKSWQVLRSPQPVLPAGQAPSFNRSGEF